MRTTVTVDDALYEQALKLASPGVDKPSALIREAIETYVRVRAGQRLAALGSAMPDMEDIPRRREEATKA